MTPEEIVSVDHNTAEEHNDLGVRYYNAGQYEKALEELLIGASLGHNWRIHKNLGIALTGLGHYKDAIAVFNNILRHQPDDAEARQMADDIADKMADSGNSSTKILSQSRITPPPTCNVCGEQNNFRDTNPENVRESLWCNRCNSLNRDRMMVYALSKCLGYDGPLSGWRENKGFRILEADGHRGHPAYLERKFEYHNTYFNTDGVQKNFEKMEFADLESLTFPDEHFDCVITCDVFEHIRLLDKALREVYRVLKKGGYFILQVPFNYGLDKTITRVQPEGDKDVFLLPAQYHGDNSLVYRDYGRDSLTHLAQLGFTAVYIEGKLPRYNVTNQNIIVCVKADTLDVDKMFNENERKSLFIEKHDNAAGKVRKMIENLCKSGANDFSETSLDYDKSKYHYYFELGHVDRIVMTLRRASPYLKSLDSVLDIGSIGDIPLILKSIFGAKNIYANSLDSGYIAYGEGRLKEKGEPNIEAEVNIEKCDIERDVFPFADGSLDAVTGFEVLEHLRTDPMFMMREVNRVLKDGGVFVLTTPNINSYQNLVKTIRLDSPCLFSTYLAGGKGIGHCKEYSVNELNQLFVNSGFSLEEISTFSPYWADPEMFKGYEDLKSLLATKGWDEKLSGQVSFVVGRKVRRPKYRFYEPLYTATEEEAGAREAGNSGGESGASAGEHETEKGYDKAIEAVELAIAQDPDNSGLWYKYAQLLQDADRYNESILQLTKVVFLDPTHSDSHNDLGVLYFQKGEHEKAVEHLTKALPFDVTLKAHRNLCNIYIRLGRYAEALEICKAILRHAPGDAEASQVVSQIGAMWNNPPTAKDENDDMHIPKTKEEIADSELRLDYMLDELLEFVQPSGTFLDVGCGWGAFLDNARSKGFRPVGLELTKKCVDFANNELRIPVMNAQLVDAAINEDSLAVVSMSHVLEHMTNPRQVLAKIHKILKPGGMFFGAVPNIDSFRSERLRERWTWLAPDVHYVYYSPETLKTQLERAGFVVRRLYTKNRDQFFEKGSLRSLLEETWGITSEEETAAKIQELEATGKGDDIRFFVSKPAEGHDMSVGTSAETARDGNGVRRECVTVHTGQAPTDTSRRKQDSRVELPRYRTETEIVGEIDRLLEAADYDRALEEVQDGILVYPASARLMYRWGEIHIGRKEWDTAVMRLKNAIALDPGLQDAYNDLGVLYVSRGEKELGVRCFVEAVKRDENDRVAMKNLAATLISIGMIVDGIRGYFTLLNKVPDDIETILQLGKIQSMWGNDRFAREYFEVALRLRPDSVEARELLDSLDKPGRAANTPDQTLSQVLEEVRFPNRALLRKEFNENKTVLAALADFLIVDPTSICNATCITCFHSFLDEKWQDLPKDAFEKVKHLISTVNQMNLFGSGEAFVARNINYYVSEAKRLKRKNMRVTICSNGKLLGKKQIELVSDPGIILQISIDAGTRDLFNHIRRGIDFDKFMKNLRLFKEMRGDKGHPALHFSCTISKRNIQEIPKIFDIAKEIGVEYIGLYNEYALDEREKPYLLDASDAPAFEAMKPVLDSYGIRYSNHLTFLEEATHDSVFEWHGQDEKAKEQA